MYSAFITPRFSTHPELSCASECHSRRLPLGFHLHHSIFPPPFELDNHARLLPEPDGLRLPLRIARRPLELEMPQDLRYELAHF